MPTTKLKNALYRAALPWKAPRLERHPALTAQGSHLYTYSAYTRLLRKHHVMGSAALLKDGNHRICLYCTSQHPFHPVNSTSLFRVASITKMATALACIVAVEQGKLTLDEPITSCFPDFPPVPELKDVTLRHLLSHTAGLMDPAGMEEALVAGKPFPEIISGCRICPPGEAFHYSNLGYGLSGCLLETAYDLSISEVLKKLVFRPLEMNATLDASELDPDQIVPITRILPYHPGQDLRITALGRIPLGGPDPLRHYGHTAGAMYLDLESLEKMMDCLVEGGAPLTSPERGRMMREKQADYGKISPTLSYGLGILRIQDQKLSDHMLFGHQGFAYGCADGAFWEEGTGRMILFLNGGASEARRGRLGACNADILRWALREEMPRWSESAR